MCVFGDDDERVLMLDDDLEKQPRSRLSLSLSPAPVSSCAAISSCDCASDVRPRFVCHSASLEDVILSATRPQHKEVVHFSELSISELNSEYISDFGYISNRAAW